MRLEYRRSERRAWQLTGVGRSSCRYQVRRRDDPALRQRLRELAGERRRFGYRRLTVLLRREGWPVNHKRVYRIYGDECLNENWFMNLQEARTKIEAWRLDYNQVRPHSALGYQTPEEFAGAARGASPPTPLAFTTQELISTPELTL